MTQIAYTLQGNAPEWSNEARWYYENMHGEQWIATLKEDTLLIAGSDIGWEEIQLNPLQAKEAFQLLIWMKEQDETSDNPLTAWILDLGERLWVASVLSVTNQLVTLK